MLPSHRGSRGATAGLILRLNDRGGADTGSPATPMTLAHESPGERLARCRVVYAPGRFFWTKGPESLSTCLTPTGEGM
jgi:hypothetical protein